LLQQPEEMSFLSMKTMIVCSMAALCLCVSAAEKKKDLKNLPPAVQQAIDRATGQGPIESVEKITEAGKTAYEVDFKQRGIEKQLVVAEDGTVLREEVFGRGKGKKDKDNKKGKGDKRQQGDNEQTPGVESRRDTPSAPAALPVPAPGRASTPAPTTAPAPVPVPTPAPPKSTPEVTTRPAPAPAPVPVYVPPAVVHVAWDKMPDKVQKALSQQKGLGSMREVKMETRHGKTLYHGYFEKGIVSYNPEGEITDSSSYWK
jgi:hypothetical protein